MIRALAAAGFAFAICACSSWNTGAPPDDAGEKACNDVVEAFARAAERCGDDYQTSHDHYLALDANGDCKNVRSVRDETVLRKTCIPAVQTISCDDLRANQYDASCSLQLQRTAAFKPSL